MKNKKPNAPKKKQTQKIETDSGVLQDVAIDEIELLVANHRQTMDPIKLRDLADSIAAIGLQQPIKVCRNDSGYTMVFGHRRMAAATMAGKTAIPAIVVEGWTDQQIAEAQVIENILREDLNPIEEAHCVQTLIDADSNFDKVASKMNKSIDWCRQRLDLLRLSAKVQALAASGRLPLKHARLIARVGDASDQYNLAAAAIGGMDEKNIVGGDHVMPLERLRDEISWMLCKLGAARWPKDVEYAKRRPCDGCVDNTNTEPVLFDGITLTSKNGNCTNPGCFEAKAWAWEKDPVKLERDAKRDAAKAAKSGGASNSNESYQDREKRVAKLRKKFPWTIEQTHALAIWEYGRDLVEAIGVTIACGRARDAALLVLAALNSKPNYQMLLAQSTPTLESLVDFTPGGLNGLDGVMADTWRCNAKPGDDYGPGLDYDGEVFNVPLNGNIANRIDALEAIAAAWKVPDLPTRPTLESATEAFATRTIVNGSRDEATRAIAGCLDASFLADLQLDDSAGKTGHKKLPKWKIKAIDQRLVELNAECDHAPAPTFDVDTCAICGCDDHNSCDGGCGWHDDEHTVCTACVDGIRNGTKKEKAGILAAIAKAPLWLLDDLRVAGLRGDWRRAAVLTQIEKLEKLEKLELEQQPAVMNANRQ